MRRPRAAYVARGLQEFFVSTLIAPVGADDTAITPAGTSVMVDVIVNDQDEDNGLDRSSVTIVDGPRNGTVTVQPDGTITYTHHGRDRFTYTIRDARGAVSCS